MRRNHIRRTKEEWIFVCPLAGERELGIAIRVSSHIEQDATCSPTTSSVRQVFALTLRHSSTLVSSLRVHGLDWYATHQYAPRRSPPGLTTDIPQVYPNLRLDVAGTPRRRQHSGKDPHQNCDPVQDARCVPSDCLGREVDAPQLRRRGLGDVHDGREFDATKCTDYRVHNPA